MRPQGWAVPGAALPFLIPFPSSLLIHSCSVSFRRGNESPHLPKLARVFPSLAGDPETKEARAKVGEMSPRPLSGSQHHPPPHHSSCLTQAPSTPARGPWAGNSAAGRGSSLPGLHLLGTELLLPLDPNPTSLPSALLGVGGNKPLEQRGVGWKCWHLPLLEYTAGFCPWSCLSPALRPSQKSWAAFSCHFAYRGKEKHPQNTQNTHVETQIQAEAR